MKFTPLCIKCRKKYDSDEPDDYYCPDCARMTNKIAEEVDKKLAMRPKKKVMSELQRYNSLLNGGKFPKASDLW